MNSSFTLPSRYEVIGTPITATTRDGALATIKSAIDSGHGGYVCFANVHATVMARSNVDFATALRKSLLSLPDGRPLYWTGRVKHISPLEHLSGPDFMPLMLDSEKASWGRHYFYGSSPETLELLVQKLKQRFPDTIIAGYESPPFRVLTNHEQRATLRRIQESGANIIWVGLGAPKQENWMHSNWEALRPAVLMGVGAAFDFHAGTLSRAPEWMSHNGLEWLYRLIKEPKRLAGRYIVTNSLFIYYSLRNLLHID